ncbi:amidohydrolase family protein [Alteromonas oceanisediminis]|uniref:amidohydrolase family protein n=1 Tax=Alteromonas oceanisediminis TaxID=2836180 RepID=UPI001BDA8A52|nr:amidohydrolase family protein [Alteromonas oceanisediminis]MBT0588182.1 amidohydrolase family protein [Alteromonas oceanisediminis]
MSLLVRLGALLVLHSLLAPSAIAQTATQTDALIHDADKVALVGGRLIDGFGHQPLSDSVVLIHNGIIQAVGQVDSLPVPQDYTIISTEGHDVLPGLWENHAHLMLNGHADYTHWDTHYADRLASEIMPASAIQLLLAGVTSVRDLGAPLDASLSVKQRIQEGSLAGPNLYISGPFIQKKPYPGTEKFRWGVDSVSDAKQKVDRLADAGVDFIKLVDQDAMTREEAQAVVDQAHKRGLKVIGHSHRPNEIRLGLEIGIDNFEHTGLTTAPEYPADVIQALKERTATGRVAGGPLFWTPTVEGLWNYERTVENPEKLDNTCWHRGLQPDTIADIQQSLQKPGQLAYMQLTPLRKPTLRRKIEQLRDAGVVFLTGTDSGIPTKFHCQSTWNELAVWVDELNIPAMDAIRAATYWPSVFMNVDDKYGTVSAGKVADIIAVKGDVLRYINLLQDVKLVMKNGTLYKYNGHVIEAALPAT